MYLVGIDVGTSVVKSTLFDHDGQEVGTAERQNVTYRPHPTWAEQDMYMVWEAVLATLRELLDTHPETVRDIAAIGLTGQGDGTWLIDQTHAPVHRAIIWSDGRSRPIVHQWYQESRSTAIFDITGTVVTTASQGPQLYWLSQHKTEVLKTAVAALHAKDWVFLCMTHALTSDDTDVSHTFFDIRRRCYADQVFDLMDIQAYRRLAPPTQPSQENRAPLAQEVAEIVGLKAGLPVVSGPFDVAAASLGVGAIEDGDAWTIVGTAAIHGITMDSPRIAPHNVGYTACHAPSDRWIRFLPTMAGTINLEWYIHTFCQEDITEAHRQGIDKWEYLERILETIPPGSEGLLYHPFLSPSGERAPFVNPFAKAQFAGLTPTHTRHHLLRAIYEGIALAAKDCYAQLPTAIARIRLAGGGARSSFWAQLLADVLGVPVETYQGCELSARGAALNAGVAINMYADYQEAVQRTVRPFRTYQPDSARTQFYSQLLEAYRAAYTAMEGTWQLW